MGFFKAIFAKGVAAGFGSAQPASSFDCLQLVGLVP